MVFPFMVIFKQLKYNPKIIKAHIFELLLLLIDVKNYEYIARSKYSHFHRIFHLRSAHFQFY